MIGRHIVTHSVPSFRQLACSMSDGSDWKSCEVTTSHVFSFILVKIHFIDPCATGTRFVDRYSNVAHLWHKLWLSVWLVESVQPIGGRCNVKWHVSTNAINLSTYNSYSVLSVCVPHISNDFLSLFLSVFVSHLSVFLPWTAQISVSAWNVHCQDHTLSLTYRAWPSTISTVSHPHFADTEDGWFSFFFLSFLSCQNSAANSCFMLILCLMRVR